jgi:hypothetical protein
MITNKNKHLNQFKLIKPQLLLYWIKNYRSEDSIEPLGNPMGVHKLRAPLAMTRIFQN